MTPCPIEYDSQAILNSIEAHHGLLVERAKNIYSFSHLTLQEYFTSRFLVDNLLKDEINTIIQANLLNKRWKEVFVITAGILPESDDFLIKMQTAIMQKYDVEGLRDILATSYTIIRDDAFFPVEIRRALSLYYALDLDRPRQTAQNLGIRLTKTRSNILALTNVLANSYSKKEKFSPVIKLSENIRYDDTRNFLVDLNKALNFNCQLVKSESDGLTIDKPRIDILNDFIQANKTLIDCLNADSYVTNESRHRIHSNVLA